MASATVATSSVFTPSAIGNSEFHQGQGHMESITVPATVKRRTSRNPSKQSSRRSVRCNLGGAHSPLVIGADRAISGTQYDADVIALGLRSRAHTSNCRNALAIGMAALAEISGQGQSACAFGIAPKAVAYCDDGNAIAFGAGPEAAALGRRGVAVAIADGEEPAIVSAGPEGRLVIVLLSSGRNTSITFEQKVDGREFRAGRRYTVDSYGFWSEVQDGYANMDDIKDFEYPASQVATA
jgi:hypothetical protein